MLTLTREHRYSFSKHNLMLVIQWNARSLLANGYEFKGYIDKLRNKPEIICIQETWLKPNLDFIIKDIIPYVKIEEMELGEGVQYSLKRV